MRKVICTIGLMFVSFNSMADSDISKIENYKRSYLFSEYLDKNKSEVASKCFKINNKSIKLLRTYNSCSSTPNGNQTPLQKLIGKCLRGENVTTYFFNTQEDCKEARMDMYENGI